MKKPKVSLPHPKPGTLYQCEHCPGAYKGLIQHYKMMHPSMAFPADPKLVGAVNKKPLPNPTAAPLPQISVPSLEEAIAALRVEHAARATVFGQLEAMLRGR